MTGGALSASLCAGDSDTSPRGVSYALTDAVVATRAVEAQESGDRPLQWWGGDGGSGTIPTRFKTDPGLRDVSLPAMRIDHVLSDVRSAARVLRATNASSARGAAPDDDTAEGWDGVDRWRGGVRCWVLNATALASLSDHYPIGCLVPLTD